MMSAAQTNHVSPINAQGEHHQHPLALYDRQDFSAGPDQNRQQKLHQQQHLVLDQQQHLEDIFPSSSVQLYGYGPPRQQHQHQHQHHQHQQQLHLQQSSLNQRYYPNYLLQNPSILAPDPAFSHQSTTNPLALGPFPLSRNDRYSSASDSISDISLSHPADPHPAPFSQPPAAESKPHTADLDDNINDDEDDDDDANDDSTGGGAHAEDVKRRTRVTAEQRLRIVQLCNEHQAQFVNYERFFQEMRKLFRAKTGLNVKAMRKSMAYWSSQHEERRAHILPDTPLTEYDKEMDRWCRFIDSVRAKKREKKASADAMRIERLRSRLGGHQVRPLSTLTLAHDAAAEGSSSTKENNENSNPDAGKKQAQQFDPLGIVIVQLDQVSKTVVELQRKYESLETQFNGLVDQVTRATSLLNELCEKLL
ncbi:hypothetical protein BZA70DRAFT_293428 [Myxozyma melibiosi]|uniref:Uncharacterized protein n=1 Tax=Myxozyma melibiosi TaxID=54550 RepID=A0ABR1FE90_9ASCO